MEQSTKNIDVNAALLAAVSGFASGIGAVKFQEHLEQKSQNVKIEEFYDFWESLQSSAEKGISFTEFSEQFKQVENLNITEDIYSKMKEDSLANRGGSFSHLWEEMIPKEHAARNIMIGSIVGVAVAGTIIFLSQKLQTQELTVDSAASEKQRKNFSERINDQKKMIANTSVGLS